MSTIYWIGSSGSQSWTTGANWSGAAAPAAGDTVWILQGSSDINTGLNNSTILLTFLGIGSGFTGTIGASGETGAFLQIGATTLKSTKGFANGQFFGGGVTRFKLDQGTNNYTAVIETTGFPQDSGFGTLRIKGGGTSSKIFVEDGSVSVADRPGDTSSLSTAQITGGTLIIGSGTTVGTSVSQNDGTLLLNASAATFTQQGGTAFVGGAASLTAATVNGECHFNNRGSSPDIGTLTAEGSAKVFFGDGTTALTNTIIAYPGAEIHAFNKSQLVVNGTTASPQIQVVGGGVDDVTIDFGNDVTIKIT